MMSKFINRTTTKKQTKNPCCNPITIACCPQLQLDCLTKQTRPSHRRLSQTTLITDPSTL